MPPPIVSQLQLALRSALFLAALAVALAAGHSAQAQQEKTKTERLLKTELDPFTADENGWTHMHWAAAANDGEAIRRLIELGGSVDPIDHADDSEFSTAGQRRAGLLGLKMGDWKNHGDTPLIVAAWFGNGIAASILITSGANVNAKAVVNDVMPLHGAAGGNVADVARMLLENGVEVNAKNSNGSTPLHYASWKNSINAARLLLENGANVNAETNGGWTPLDRAIHEGHDEMQSLLRQHGGSCNKKC